MWWFKIIGMVSGINVKKMLGYVVFVFGSQTIPALEADLAKSQEDLRFCGKSNARLSTAIDKNNARIDEYAQLTEDLEASIIILGNELTVERERTDTEVEVILKDPTPKTCEKAIDYLRDGTKDLKW